MNISVCNAYIAIIILLTCSKRRGDSGQSEGHSSNRSPKPSTPIFPTSSNSPPTTRSTFSRSSCITSSAIPAGRGPSTGNYSAKTIRTAIRNAPKAQTSRKKHKSNPQNLAMISQWPPKSPTRPSSASTRSTRSPGRLERSKSSPRPRRPGRRPRRASSTGSKETTAFRTRQ